MRAYLQCGITSVIDMGSTVAGMLQLEKGLETGRLIGPDLYFSGPLFTAPNGHPAGTIYRGQHDLIDNAAVQVSARRPGSEESGRAGGRRSGFHQDRL